MNSWLAKHKKAVGGALGALTAELSAVLALGVLSGPASHDIALTLAILTPAAAFFGTKAAPQNRRP